MKEKRKLRLLRAFTLIALIVLSAAFFMTSCGGSGTAGASVQVEGIDEPDIIKVTDEGYIFNVQSDGLTVTRAGPDGRLSKYMDGRIEGYTPKEIFIYGNTLLLLGEKTVSKFLQASRIYTYVYFYDLDTLKGKEGKDVAPFRESSFVGKYNTARIVKDTFCLFTYTTGYGRFKSSVYRDSVMGQKNGYDVSGTLKYKPSLDYPDDDDSVKDCGAVIARLDLTDTKAARYRTGAYTGVLDTVYVSERAFYAIVDTTPRKGCANRPKSNSLARIDISTLEVTGYLSNSAGAINSRFSLHDKDGFLYIVYGSTYLTVYDAALKPVSEITVDSEHEFQAVRYDGDYCYVVTYRTIDPVYKIDISDPLEPAISGELEIPGFSTFLQPFGEGRMVGIGFDDDVSTVKITLFDTVGDAPAEIESLLFEKSSTDAAGNIKSALYDTGSSFIAVPMLREGGAKQGAAVLRVSDEGITERGFLSCADYGSGLPVEYERQHVKRVARIGEFLYTVSDGFIASYSLDTLALIDKLDFRLETKITVTFISEMSGTPTIKIVEAQPGSIITPPEYKAKGYTFKGWYLYYNATPVDFSQPVYNSCTVRARWEAEIVES